MLTLRKEHSTTLPHATPDGAKPSRAEKRTTKKQRGGNVAGHRQNETLGTKWRQHARTPKNKICPRNLAARPRCRGCRAASQESCSARDCARLLGTRREAKAAREMLPRMHAKHQASERPDSSPVGLRVGTRLETFTEEQKAHEKGIGGGTAGGKVRPACADGAIGTRQGTPAARPRGCVGRVPRRGEAATRGVQPRCPGESAPQSGGKATAVAVQPQVRDRRAEGEHAEAGQPQRGAAVCGTRRPPVRSSQGHNSRSRRPRSGPAG